MEKSKVYIISGPTAVGKSAVAMSLAKKLNGEIVNCDSVQLYKHMDIGSAKPAKSDMASVPHHLFSIVLPDFKMTAATYQQIALATIDDILSRGKTPIVVGGTGLYMNAIMYDMDFAGQELEDEDVQSNRRLELEKMAEKMGNEYMHAYLSGIDPDSAQRIHPNNIRKVIRAIEAFETGDGIKPLDSCPLNSKYDFELFVLNMDRKWLYDRINRRVIEMYKQGLFKEVKSLVDMGYSIENSSMKAIGYKEVLSYLNGELSGPETIKLISKNSRRYAKRQITWFKRYEFAKWIEIGTEDTVSDITDSIINMSK